MSYLPFVIASDFHGSQQDPKAMAAFYKFCKVWKPKIRVVNGDLWDMVPLRRGASSEEQRESMLGDMEAGLEILTEFKPNVFLLGNHDVRLWNLREKGTGIQRDFATTSIQKVDDVCKKLDCKILPYNNRDGIYEVGKLSVMHGFGSGLGMARRMVAAYGSLVLGHLHTIDIVSVESTHTRMGRLSGCLCRLDMPYAATTLANLRWAHGFAYGVVDPISGNYFVWQAEAIDGTWMFPTSLTEIHS